MAPAPQFDGEFCETPKCLLEGLQLGELRTDVDINSLYLDAGKFCGAQMPLRADSFSARQMSSQAPRPPKPGPLGMAEE